MSIVLTLPAELESKLVSIASERGVSVPDFVRQVLEDKVSTMPPPRPAVNCSPIGNRRD